jgi:hypothetical protein
LPDFHYQRFNSVSYGENTVGDSNMGQHPKLLDQDRQVLRLHHCSIHTERAWGGENELKCWNNISYHFRSVHLAAFENFSGLDHRSGIIVAATSSRGMRAG